mgnify:CR=1 FL=1
MGIRGGCEYGFWRECDIPELGLDEQAREKDTMGDLQDPGFTPGLCGTFTETAGRGKEPAGPWEGLRGSSHPHLLAKWVSNQLINTFRKKCF